MPGLVWGWVLGRGCASDGLSLRSLVCYLGLSAPAGWRGRCQIGNRLMPDLVGVLYAIFTSCTATWGGCLIYLSLGSEGGELRIVSRPYKVQHESWAYWQLWTKIPS